MGGYTLLDVAFASAIMALGGAVQRAAGFGVALIVVPPLALIDESLVPGPMLVAAGTLSAFMAWRGWGELRAKEVVPSAIGLVLGSVLAAVALTLIARDNLPYVFGAMILLAVGASLSGLRPPFTTASLLGAGAAGGFMGTIAGPHGPPIALVYQHHEGIKVRPALGAFFALAALISLAALSAVDRFGWAQGLVGLGLIPGAFVGYAVGAPIGRWFDRGRLRMAILAISAASALALIIKG
ncbi:MAG: TSUP family transporter [Alphaproteobacteria bacterium]